MTMASGFIFVEGRFDERIINKVVDGLEITVRQGAGKFGQKAFMDGFLASTAVKPDFYFAFRDRDFDYPMSDSPKLILPEIDKGRVVVCHRTTIENYLLTPASFQKFKDLDRQNKFKEISTELYSSLLEDSARQLAAYQAIRHSLGKIRDRNQIPTTWTSGSGDLPASLDSDNCMLEAKRILEAYHSKSIAISETGSFEDTCRDFAERFGSNAFYEGFKYLEWFQAKDIIGLLSKKLQQYVPQFSINSLMNIAIELFDYNDFEDLVQLRDHIEQLTKTRKQ